MVEFSQCPITPVDPCKALFDVQCRFAVQKNKIGAHADHCAHPLRTCGALAASETSQQQLFVQTGGADDESVFIWRGWASPVVEEEAASCCKRGLTRHLAKRREARPSLLVGHFQLGREIWLFCPNLEFQYEHSPVETPNGGVDQRQWSQVVVIASWSSCLTIDQDYLERLVGRRAGWS